MKSYIRLVPGCPTNILWWLLKRTVAHNLFGTKIWCAPYMENVRISRPWWSIPNSESFVPMVWEIRLHNFPKGTCGDGNCPHRSLSRSGWLRLYLSPIKTMRFPPIGLLLVLSVFLLLLHLFFHSPEGGNIFSSLRECAWPNVISHLTRCKIFTVCGDRRNYSVRVVHGVCQHVCRLRIAHVVLYGSFMVDDSIENQRRFKRVVPFQ